MSDHKRDPDGPFATFDGELADEVEFGATPLPPPPWARQETQGPELPEPSTIRELLRRRKDLWALGMVCGVVLLIGMWFSRPHDRYSKQRDEVRSRCPASHVGRKPIAESETFTVFPARGYQSYPFADFKADDIVVRVWGPLGGRGVQYVVLSCDGDRE